MDLNHDWPIIRGVFKRAFESSFHYSVATTNEDGTPHIAPIGSLLLDPKEPKGFYFEVFTAKTRANLARGSQFSVLAVDARKRFWLKSLWRGKFETPVGIRLYGKAGIEREASESEVARFRKRTRMVKSLKGHDLLWGNLKRGREVVFHRADLVNVGPLN